MFAVETLQHTKLRNVKFQLYGDVKYNHLKIIDDLLLIVETECDRHKDLDRTVRLNISKLITNYLISIEWIPLLLTCDETNNKATYLRKRSHISKTLNIDIMFTYKYNLNIQYACPK